MNGRDIRICTIFAFAKVEFMEKLHPIMFAGTGSDVGKSIIAAAFCRIFKQDGYQPAPFKAQNMALNSFATPEGLEIGRAQAVQAEAAGVPCHTDMNPLLLKPQSDHTSQVVLNGRPIGNRNAYDYSARKDATNCAGRFVLPTTALPPAIIPLCWKAREASPKSICGIPTLSICRWPCMPEPM